MGENIKIGVVIISHGQLATELVAAAEAVIGDIGNIMAVSIGWHDDVELADNAIDRAIKAVSCGSGVLLLTDMFGGTPTNLAATFLKHDEIEMVTGVNLPMVIKAVTAEPGTQLGTLAAEVEQAGKAAITRAADLLAPVKGK